MLWCNRSGLHILVPRRHKSLGGCTRNNIWHQNLPDELPLWPKNQPKEPFLDFLLLVIDYHSCFSLNEVCLCLLYLVQTDQSKAWNRSCNDFSLLETENIFKKVNLRETEYTLRKDCQLMENSSTAGNYLSVGITEWKHNRLQFSRACW